MKIYANLLHEVDIDPVHVIEKLVHNFLGDHGRWVEKITNNSGERICIMENSYHNSSREVREISARDLEYLDSLYVIQKYLQNGN